MAHRLVFNPKNRDVHVYEYNNNLRAGHPWRWHSISTSHVVLQKGTRKRNYAVREWISPIECRATQLETLAQEVAKL